MKTQLWVLPLLGLATCSGEEPPRICKSTVTIQMYGDSTQVDAYASGYLQRELDVRYGAGRVTLLLQAVAGTNSTQLIAGTDGLNTPWPSNVSADIAIVNHGINDEAWGVPMAIYAANLDAFAHGPSRMVIETPNPITTHDLAERAEVGRQAAAKAGIPVADVFAYVMALPDWPAMLADGVHPTAELQLALARSVTSPVLEPVIDTLLCP